MYICSFNISWFYLFAAGNAESRVKYSYNDSFSKTANSRTSSATAGLLMRIRLSSSSAFERRVMPPAAECIGQSLHLTLPHYKILVLIPITELVIDDRKMVVSISEVAE